MIDTEIRALFTEAIGDDMPTCPTPGEDVARGRRLRTRRRLRNAAVGTVGAATAIVLAMTLTPGVPLPNGDTGDVAAGSEQSLTTDVHPRILLDDPEWSVWRARLDDRGGSIHYKNGLASLHFGWYRFDDPGTTSLGNYTAQGVPEVPVEILGRQAVIFEVSDDYFELVWQEDGVEFGAYGEFDSIDEFRTVIARLYEADDETWQAVIRDATRRYDNADAVAEIASNVPVTDAFEIQVKERFDFIDPADEELLTQEVMHWVACGWVRQRLDGAPNQDPSYVDDQLTQVLDWASAHGAVTDEAVWDYAEAIVTGADTVNGRPLYDPFYAAEALRCGGW